MEKRYAIPHLPLSIVKVGRENYYINDALLLLFIKHGAKE